MSGVYVVMSPNSQAVRFFVKILAVSLVCPYSEKEMMGMFSLTLNTNIEG